jgi:hypothetical protein
MLELGDRAGRRCLVDQFFLEFFEFPLGKVVEVEVLIQDTEIASNLRGG